MTQRRFERQSSGRQLGRQAGIAITVDLVCVALFAWYLLTARSVRA
jgi:hypothetical protein